MKIKNLSTIAISCMMLLTACSGDFEVAPKDTDSLEGLLSSQSANDDYLGTHLLLLDSGDFEELRSLSINLSGDSYLNNRVEVTGFYNDDEVFQVTGVKVLEVTDDLSDDREKITYKNVDLGFEISYFNDWTMEESTASVNFVAKNEDVVIINQRPFAYVPESDEDGNTDTPFMAYFSEAGISDEYTEKVIGKNSLPAVSLETSDTIISYYLYRAGLIYEISLVAADTITAEHERVFKEMLSDFAFTNFSMGEGSIDPIDEDEDETEGEIIGGSDNLPEVEYKLTGVFESLPYSFRGSYPSNWYYAGSRSSESGVLHEYKFSDEVVEDNNELLTLKVSSSTGPLSGSNKLKMADREIVLGKSGSNSQVATSVGDFTFRLTGPDKYQDLMVNIAASIHLID